jgi:predicted XRE-type DNA-binding protein
MDIRRDLMGIRRTGKQLALDEKRFASVWDAIEETPEKAENVKLRSSLMMALKTHLERSLMRVKLIVRFD